MAAADKLLGLTLNKDWKVVRHLGRNPNATGGTFSEGYVVEKPGRTGFLKAFDFWEAFRRGVDTAAEIQRLTTAYNYERDILNHCGGKRMSRVVLAIDSGQVQIPNMTVMEGTVFYLIFEMAAGDVRVQMSTATAHDALWSMQALRDVTLGLHQIHREMIAHQDAKPSNVLLYDGPLFKIADFGRSSRKGKPAPYDGNTIAGDREYAPPELLYSFEHQDFSVRRLGCDLFMLGNLATFLFTGVNVTQLLLSYLDPQHHPSNWGGQYKDVLPYLQNAFTRVLQTIAPLIDANARDEVLRFVRELCNPDIDRRGHPKNVGTPNQHSLERYVSETSLTVKRLEVRLRAGKVAA